MTPIDNVVYNVTIVRREFQQTAGDYHATVTRMTDGAQLIFIARWMWLLHWSTRRAALGRAFARLDHRNAQLAKIRRFTR